MLLPSFNCAIVFAFLATLVHAASDDKTRLGNETIDRTVQLRTHSLYAPYIDQDLQNRWWDFGADAYVNTNKHIRLTRLKPSQMGWLWSRLPLTATNFVLEVEFKISGESSHLFGDGLAIWLTKERALPGPVFGSKDRFTGLGIFLDTYSNSRHSYSFPRVNAMLGDGRTSYDVGSDGEKQIFAGCSANYRRTNVGTKLKITYLKDKFLDVKIHYKAWDDWVDCIFVQNVTLPPTPYIGFSALTGDVYDAHDIISVTTSSAILTVPSAPRDKLQPKPGEGIVESGSWLTFFYKVIVFGGLCAGAFYGYKEYTRRKAFGGIGGGNAYRGAGGMSLSPAPGGGFGGLYADSKRY
ncbi:hypothetical protein AX16_004470 [Volvariella volvacea WC 439]|nr:hypothetical protein AX16_004470 [Volvariella volvacea WC 439]